MPELSASVKTIITITFFVYSALLVFVAVYSGKRMAHVALKSYVDEFYTGGKGLGVIFIAFIVSAAICSSGTFVGGPGLVHSMGIAWALVNFFSFAFLNLNVLGTIGKKLGIIGRRINASTYMDVLMVRYNNNKLLLIAGVIIICVFLITYCSAQFMGGARMLEVVTGLDYSIAIVLFAVVVIAYSTFGGINGVGLAAIIQGVFMTIGALLMGFGAIHYAGGMGNMFHSLEAVNQTMVQPQAQSIGYMFSIWVTFGLIYLAMPHGTLGVLAYKNTQALNKAIIIGVIFVPIWAISMNFSGLASIGIFPGLEVPDHTTPLMAATVLNPVFAGIVIAGAVSAAQSTIAAMILAISGTMVKNVYSKINPHASYKTLRTVTVSVTLGVGLVTFLMALNPPPQLEWIVIFAIGGLASAFFWPLLLGLYWTRMNEWGATAGTILGVAAYMTGKRFYPPFAFGVDPILIGVIISLIGCVVVSLITPSPSMKILQLFWGAKPIGDAVSKQ